MCRYSTLNEVKLNTLLLNCGLHTVTSFLGIQIGKGEGGKEYCTMEEPDKYYFSLLIKVNINS